jgi:hypothetical protein
MYDKTILCALALGLSVATPAAVLAAEEESEVEAPEADAPPSTPPAARPSAPPPGQRTAPVYPPGAYPAPIWGMPHAPAAPPPQADRPVQPEPPEEPEEPEGIVIPRWQLSVGVRTAFVTNAGYDPFSDNDVLVQFSVGAGRTFYSQGMFSVAAIGFYDFSNQQSTARGQPTELEVHRLSLGPEVRAHLMPVLYAFARPSAAALRTSASLQEATANTTLYARAWTVGFDVTAGAAFRVVSSGRGESAARFWLVGEGGYGWSSSSDLRLATEPEDETAPQRVAEVSFGTLALRGPLFRISLAATF